MDEKDIREEVATEGHLSQVKSHGLHHDHVAQEALGGTTGDLPKGYYRSAGFIGTVVVSSHSKPLFQRPLLMHGRPHVSLKYQDTWDGSYPRTPSH
jgi:hypothetical protein